MRGNSISASDLKQRRSSLQPAPINKRLWRLLRQRAFSYPEHSKDDFIGKRIFTLGMINNIQSIGVIDKVAHLHLRKAAPYQHLFQGSFLPETTKPDFRG